MLCLYCHFYKLHTIAAIDSTDPALCALREDQLLDGLVFAATDSVVTDVWSAGRHQVQGGRHMARDAVVSAYKDAMVSVMSAL